MKDISIPMMVALLATGPALGQILTTETYYFRVGTTAWSIPDGVGSSVFNQIINTSQIKSITQVQVGLNLSGSPSGEGWAGDMFVSLNSNLSGKTAVLLNQAGVTGSNPAGYGFDGWNVTFQDRASNGDIHFGRPVSPASVLTGTWQPDGRLSPSDSSRPSTLDAFNGGVANAAWYLNVADLSPGGTMTLQAWTLTLSGFTSVPEPSGSVSVVGLGLGLFALIARRQKMA